jgi:CDP-paratose 2-epimerase
MSTERPNVLIFGGAGFVGSNWAEHLLRNTEASVHIADNLSRAGVRSNLESLLGEFKHTGRLTFTRADVREQETVTALAENADEIYNFAAQVAVTTSIEDPRTDLNINVLGTFNVLEAARKSGKNPFVLFTSTNKVYGDLEEHAVRTTATRYEFESISGVTETQALDFHSPYGCSKGAADQYVRDYARIYGLRTVVFRMSCIAGPRQFGNEDQGWVAHFLYSALKGNTIVIYGDGKQVRDVLCVKDLVRAFAAARENAERTAGEIYNIGGGPERATSLLEILPKIEQVTGEQVAVVHDELRPGDQLVYVSDYGKFRQHTGWRPEISLQQTIELIHSWWQQNQALFGEQPSTEEAERRAA